MKYFAAPASRVELGDAGGVEDGFVEALAVLAGDAAVAELQRRRERAELAVGLVDDQRLQPGQRVDRLLQRRGALDRLLDEQRGGHQPLQRRRLAHAPPQLGDALDRVVLLVAVERGPVRRRRRGRARPAMRVSRSRSASMSPATLSL